jgi:cytochrome c oxidase subunit 2
MQLNLLGFQDPVTPIMEGIVDLHNHIMFYLIMILVFVIYVFFGLLWSFFKPFNFPHSLRDLNVRFLLLEGKNITHGTSLEVVWTVTPSIILMLIAVPSFALLYSMDEVIDPSITLKAIGHQWYWHYEYSDYQTIVRESIEFDSYMLPTSDLEIGQFRLLEVDNQVVLPVMTHIRVLVTASDVLHSWAVPSLGVKIDSVPGRLNQVSLFIKREGIYYGQCSELCGVNHGFMPIVIKATTMENYFSWLGSHFVK